MALFANTTDASKIPAETQASGRTLAAQGSHADSPQRKQQKKDEPAAMKEDTPVTDSAKLDKILEMVLEMQHGNTETNATVKQIQVDMKDVKDTANDAKAAADTVLKATDKLETVMEETMSEYKKELEEVKEKVKKPPAPSPSPATSPWVALPATSSAWAIPPCTDEQEEKSRTLTSAAGQRGRRAARSRISSVRYSRTTWAISTTTTAFSHVEGRRQEGERQDSRPLH